MENIWNDKKRILGMPITFTKYSIRGNKFYSEKGLITTDRDIMMLYRIIDVSMNQTLIQRLCGVGSLVLMTNDKSHSEFTIESVKDPEKVMDLISDLVEKERKQQGIKTTEILSYSDNDNDKDIFGD